MKFPKTDRRAFLQHLAAGVAGLSCTGAVQSGGPPPPSNVRLVGWEPDPVSSRELLSTSDFVYRGMWRASSASGAADESVNYCRGPIALRRVNGELRVLMVGRLPAGTSTNPYPGPLMEFALPATTGEKADTAPELIKLREWRGSWCSGFYYTGNGCNVGGMWYDQQWDVLWYTIYATYGGPDDPPFLGASKLHADGTVTKYGPWRHPMGGQRYRTSSWWIYEAPASVKAANPLAEMCLGAAVGSTAAEGNWGPGLYWYKRPELHTSGILRASEWGPLMGYSSLYGPHPDYFCRRPADYHSVYPEAAGYVQPRNGQGFWIASLDQMSGHVWIEGTSKWGIATLGRMVAPNRWIWYPNEIATRGTNPHTYNGVTYYDSGSPASNGYKAGVIWPSTDTSPGFEPAMLLFDPSHPLEIVANSGRAPYDVQYYSRVNWQKQWNLPLVVGNPMPSGIATYPSPGDCQIIDSPQGQPATSAYDPASKTLVWMLPRTYYPGFARYPTFQVWTVNA